MEEKQRTNKGFPGESVTQESSGRNPDLKNRWTESNPDLANRRLILGFIKSSIPIVNSTTHEVKNDDYRPPDYATNIVEARPTTGGEIQSGQTGFTLAVTIEISADELAVLGFGNEGNSLYLGLRFIVWSRSTSFNTVNTPLANGSELCFQVGNFSIERQPRFNISSQSLLVALQNDEKLLNRILSRWMASVRDMGWSVSPDVNLGKVSDGNSRSWQLSNYIFGLPKHALQKRKLSLQLRQHFNNQRTNQPKNSLGSAEQSYIPLYLAKVERALLQTIKSQPYNRLGYYNLLLKFFGPFLNYLTYEDLDKLKIDSSFTKESKTGCCIDITQNLYNLLRSVELPENWDLKYVVARPFQIRDDHPWRDIKKVGHLMLLVYSNIEDQAYLLDPSYNCDKLIPVIDGSIIVSDDVTIQISNVRWSNYEQVAHGEKSTQRSLSHVEVSMLDPDGGEYTWTISEGPEIITSNIINSSGSPGLGEPRQYEKKLYTQPLLDDSQIVIPKMLNQVLCSLTYWSFRCRGAYDPDTQLPAPYFYCDIRGIAIALQKHEPITDDCFKYKSNINPETTKVERGKEFEFFTRDDLISNELLEQIIYSYFEDIVGNQSLTKYLKDFETAIKTIPQSFWQYVHPVK